MTKSSYRMTMSALAAAVAIGAGAARAEDAAESSASLDVSGLSAYVWRGQVLNDEAVLQPSLTVSKGGFTINWWANAALTDATTGDSGEFTEHDIGLSYAFTCPLTGAGVTLGLVNYDFPNQALTDTNGAVNALVADTTEAYVILAFGEVPLAPTLSVYYDFKEVDGLYGNLGVSHSFELNDKASLNASASVGFANSDYNSVYFGVDDDALNDANIGLSVPFTVTESLTITPGVQYTWLPESDIKDGAEGLYKDTEQVVGSIKASYAF